MTIWEGSNTSNAGSGLILKTRKYNKCKYERKDDVACTTYITNRTYHAEKNKTVCQFKSNM